MHVSLPASSYVNGGFFLRDKCSLYTLTIQFLSLRYLFCSLNDVLFRGGVLWEGNFGRWKYKDCSKLPFESLLVKETFMLKGFVSRSRIQDALVRTRPLGRRRLQPHMLTQPVSEASVVVARALYLTTSFSKSFNSCISKFLCFIKN
jgi:hypothetical protein